MKDETLFDKNILEGTIPKLPSGLRIRPLQLDDYYNGFLQLLTQLTSVGEVSFEKFGQQFNAMKNANPQAYYVIVIEEESTKKIVGASTLVIELKFIHEAGCRGRVEDVVVASRACEEALGVQTVSRVRTGILISAGPVMSVPSPLCPEYKVVLHDRQWIHHKLSPEEDLDIPLHERPDPDNELLQQATSLIPPPYRKHSFLIDFEKRFTDVGLQSLNISGKRETFCIEIRP
ncbi:hypothetical protein QR680_000026 [Steinernema hermaphroditum]|uniref:Glucosamine 6-phosphate N-acetyltransferase n=1 Tax=Steinernema hermaphroditum TaxID=289476 RepID=A0AA39GT85_9BILA|nr:hypothetical protein QR680_000026 [Steinernema hermaphroditum]